MFFSFGMSIAGHSCTHIIPPVDAAAAVVICFHFSLFYELYRVLPVFPGRIFFRCCVFTAQFRRFCILSSVHVYVCVLCDCVIYFMLIVCFHMRNRHIKCRLRLKFTFGSRSSSSFVLLRKSANQYVAHTRFSFSFWHSVFNSSLNFDFWKVHSAHLFIVFFYFLSLPPFFPRTSFHSHCCFFVVACVLSFGRKTKTTTTNKQTIAAFFLFLSFFMCFFWFCLCVCVFYCTSSKWKNCW